MVLIAIWPVQKSENAVHLTGHNNSGTKPVSAKFIGPTDRQDKYVIGPICLISSRTEMSDVASNTMYTYVYYVYSESDRYKFGPMK